MIDQDVDNAYFLHSGFVEETFYGELDVYPQIGVASGCVKQGSCSGTTENAVFYVKTEAGRGGWKRVFDIHINPGKGYTRCIEGANWYSIRFDYYADDTPNKITQQKPNTVNPN